MQQALIIAAEHNENTEFVVGLIAIALGAVLITWLIRKI